MGHQSKRRCKKLAKISANYEVVFIIDPAQGEEGVAALTEKFKTLVEQNSSALVKEINT